MRQKSRIFIGILLLFLITCHHVNASEYETKYEASYQIHDNGDASVQLHVDITNNTARTYVSQFALSLPVDFQLEQISASDRIGPMHVKQSKNDQLQKISVSFNNPQVGVNSINSFDLRYMQKKVLVHSGNIWELIIPVIQDASSNYTISVFPPSNIAQLTTTKPPATTIATDKITWKNPSSKTIYAVFGSTQHYRMQLTYSLKNDRFTPIYTDIALPPDTAYQTTILEHIDPLPEKTYLDDDGNFMARFTIPSRGEQKIVYKGYATIFASPIDAFKSTAEMQFKKNQAKYVTPKQYWNIHDEVMTSETKSLTTPQSIYDFVTKKLTYSYKRVKKTAERLGANGILNDPVQAVCMEFTDLFIALARYHNIAARENQGYGYSDDSTLRPLSLVSDILHSWPEYYDVQKKTWIQIDPTWGNTSGIDYFNSLDMNHITFAIHGLDSTYPLPAGTYKTKESKDVIIEPISSIPQAKSSIETSDTFRQKITAGDTQHAQILIQNTGNVYINTAHLRLKSPQISFNPSDILIQALAPHEKKTIDIQYQGLEPKKTITSSVTIWLDSKQIQSKQIEVMPNATRIKQFQLIALFALVIAFIIYVTIFKHRS